MFSVPYIVCSLLSFVPAIVLHEMGHALMAKRLGDTTAYQRKRTSINPLNHIDPFGTVLLPLMLMAVNMPVFGYAKPVPYNPHNFKNPRRDDFLVGIAGPCMNLLLALLAAAIAYVLYRYAPLNVWLNDAIFSIFFTLYLPLFAFVNLYLMFFNLLPVPPLDGSSLFALIMPKQYLPQYYAIQRYAFPVFIIVVIVLPQVAHIDLFSGYFDVTARALGRVLFPFMQGI